MRTRITPMFIIAMGIERGFPALVQGANPCAFAAHKSQ
jgi:hypothetical protein